MIWQAKLRLLQTKLLGTPGKYELENRALSFGDMYMSLSLLQICSKSVLIILNLEKSLEIGSSPIYSDRSVHGRQKKKESHGWSWDRDDPDVPTHVCSCQGCLLESQPTSSVPACELSRGQARLLADRALDASDDDFVRGENGTVPTQRYLQRSTGECVP